MLLYVSGGTPLFDEKRGKKKKRKDREKGELNKKKLRFKKSEMHRDLPIKLLIKV